MLTAQVGPHQLAASEGERCPGPAQAVLAGPALCRQRLPLPRRAPEPSVLRPGSRVHFRVQSGRSGKMGI